MNESLERAEKNKPKCGLWDKDPITGKLISLPLPDTLWKREKKSSEKKIKKRALLQPLVLSDLDFEESIPKKKRKTDIVVATTIPQQSKRISERLSNKFSSHRVTEKLSHASASKIHFNQKQTKNSTKRPFPEHDSPLLNLEDVEDELVNTKSALKGFSFKYPRPIPVKLNFSKTIPKIITTPGTPRMSTIDEEDKSNDTFIQNELDCLGTPFILTDIENTNINTKNITKIIEHIIKVQEEYYEKYTKTHRENITHLKSLLSVYSDSSKSQNIEKKSPLGSLPTSKQRNNLRTTVLKKNVEYGSPRTNEAMNLYNSMRATNSVLQTPRLERRLEKESPNKELSNKLMQQCLLLQGTPVSNQE